MASTGDDFVAQLLRKRAEADREYTQYTAEYVKKIEALDTLLRAEGHGVPAITQDAAGAPPSGTPRARLRGDEYNRRRIAERNAARSEEDKANQHRMLVERHQRHLRQTVAEENATARQLVRRVLEALNGPAKMSDVVLIARDVMGPQANEDTIRSALQRMVHSGEAEKVERGMYRLSGRPSEAAEPDDFRDFNAQIVEVEPG